MFEVIEGNGNLAEKNDIDYDSPSMTIYSDDHESGYILLAIPLNNDMIDEDGTMVFDDMADIFHSIGEEISMVDVRPISEADPTIINSQAQFGYCVKHIGDPVVHVLQVFINVDDIGATLTSIPSFMDSIVGLFSEVSEQSIDDKLTMRMEPYECTVLDENEKKMTVIRKDFPIQSSIISISYEHYPYTNVIDSIVDDVRSCIEIALGGHEDRIGSVTLEIAGYCGVDMWKPHRVEK